MTAEDAAIRLQHCLAQDASGRYFFTCKKGSVMVKLFGNRGRFCFAARQKIAFRAGPAGLTVERFDNGTVKQRFPWDQIECIAAGELECDNGPLFQG